MINLFAENKIFPAQEANFSERSAEERLPGTIQWLLRIFAFFLAFPSIDFVGISISFYIFFLILAVHLREHIPILTRDKTNKWFVLLFITGTISTIFHPPLDIEVSVIADIKIIFQYLYWITLSIYIRSNFSRIDWKRFSRSLFWGLCALVIGYYFLPVKVDLALFQITSDSTRNNFVYNLLCLFPLIVWYLRYSKLERISPILLLLFVLSILYSNGRAGFVLIVIQTLLIGLIIYPRLDNVFKAGLIILILVFFIWQLKSDSGITAGIARSIEGINPRMSEMINKEGNEGDLTKDKSWLLRKLMVDKSKEIVIKYPFFGIGWMHFDNYYSELKTRGNYKRLSSLGNEFLNTRSAHNSYTLYMAEGGIIGFAILLVILFIVIYPFFQKLFHNNFSIKDLPLVAMVTLAIYFYAISSITGAGTWFVIGTSLGAIKYEEISGLS
jgi:hypothetical protein